jgi:hypothetical protein
MVTWVSTDNFVTTVVVGDVTPTNITGCCRGEVVYYNGKIYFSSGFVGGSAQFMRIS